MSMLDGLFGPKSFILHLPAEHTGYLTRWPWPLPTKWTLGDAWEYVMRQSFVGTTVNTLRFEYIEERTNRLNMQTDWDVFFTVSGYYVPLSRMKRMLMANEPIVVRDREAVVFVPETVKWLLVRLDELEERGIR